MLCGVYKYALHEAASRVSKCKFWNFSLKYNLADSQKKKEKLYLGLCKSLTNLLN